MNILSLFDGMSCGRVALERAGIKVDNYYASEIDPYAIKVSQKNYPDIIQLGDVRFWETWGLRDIDMVIAGSPCQGFSNAGGRLNFDDPRSKLFFTFVDILEHYKPKYFLLENVMMKKEWENIITEHMGVEPIEINSALVSAQNRRRLYWTNIPNITQPEDRKIFLRDIVLSEVTNKVLPVRVTGRRLNEEGKRDDYNTDIPKVQMVEITDKDKANCLSTVQKDSMLFSLNELIHSEKAIEYMNRETTDGRNHWDFGHYSDIDNEKSAAIVANFFKGVPYNVFKDWNCIRRFHPIECERLQTLEDGYSEGVSNTQRYKMIGNGWTVDVIAHIFSFI